MAENSKIEWTDHTFNPWRGCTKVATGCKNCYAEAMSKRNPGVLGIWGPDGTRVVAAEAMWRKPLKWAKDARTCRHCGEPPPPSAYHCLTCECGVELPRPRVFCGSMCDVFEDRPELVEPRARLFALIKATPELDWLLLTKRPENIRRLMNVATGEIGHALPNIWLGTSVACQEDADKNISALLKIPAAVRFVSYEPAVGPVDFTRWIFTHRCTECMTSFVAGHADDHAPCPRCGEEETCPACNWLFHPHLSDVEREAGRQALHWIIVGGESGGNARPFDVARAQSTVEQCKAAGVACFVKQLGRGASMHTDDGRGFHHRDSNRGGYIVVKHPKGADMAEWPEDLRVREFPEVTS